MSENDTIKELLEKKDFLSFFKYSNPKYIIEVLLSLKQEHFSDIKHYTFYSKYIKPKLKQIGKAFATRTYSRYNRYLYYFAAEIVISKTYLLIKFTRYRYRIEFVDNGYGFYSPAIDFSGERSDAYLLGFNSDGKLFANKVSLSTIDYRSSDIKGYDIWHSYGVIVVYANDSLIHQILGYNFDFGDQERIVINDNGVYRVQGEVLINAFKVDYRDVSDTIGTSEPIGIVHNAIYDYMQRFIANEIMAALVNIGFDIDYARELNARGITYHNALIIPNVVQSDIDIRRARSYFELIIKSLQKVLQDYSILYNRENNDSIDTFVMKNDLIEAVIGIDIVNTENDNRYSSIIITPLRIIVENSKMYHIIFKELKDSMRSVRKQDYSIALGNHLINIKNAIALNIEYTPSIRPRIPILSDWSIRFNLGFYYVSQDSMVVISHKDHGNVEILFNGKFLIEFRVTNTSIDHRFEWNRAVLESLIIT